MSTCINKNHPDVLRIAEELNTLPAVAAAKIGVWQENNNILDRFPSTEELSQPSQVNYSLKAVEILSSDKAKQTFEKGKKNGWDLNKILTELQVPKEQKQIILDKNIENTNILNSKKELNRIAESNPRLEKIAKLLANKSSDLNRIVNVKLKSAGLAVVDFINEGQNVITDVAIDEDNIDLVIRHRPDLKDLRDEVIVHEEVHRFTQGLLKYAQLAKDNNTTLSDIGFTKAEENFINEIEELYRQYKATNNNNRDFKQPNESLDEFLTYGLTNAAFIKELSSIKVENTSILNKLINLLKSLFSEVSIKNALDKSFENYITANNVIDEISNSTEYFTPKDFNLREEIITSLLADNSFTVEINVSKDNNLSQVFSNGKHTVIDNNYQPLAFFDTKEEADNYIKNYDTNRPTQYYSDLTVPGGTNYTENEIATPAITPSIKGHAQFSTDNGIGWFRSDNQEINLSLLEQQGIIKKVPC